MKALSILAFTVICLGVGASCSRSARLLSEYSHVQTMSGPSFLSSVPNIPKPSSEKDSGKQGELSPFMRKQAQLWKTMNDP